MVQISTYKKEKGTIKNSKEKILKQANVVVGATLFSGK